MSGIIAQNTLDNSGLVKAPEGGGAWNFIKKLTASSSATLSFVNGTSDVVLDSTYKTYVFTFNNIHPQNDAIAWSFNGSTDTGSNYNVTKTTTMYSALHAENDSEAGVGYRGVDNEDLAQGTGFQDLTYTAGAGASNDSDNGVVGELHLFSPSDTTFATHFKVRTQVMHDSGSGNIFSMDTYTAGYFNTTSAVDAIQFKFGSGNIDTGDICLYGIST